MSKLQETLNQLLEPLIEQMGYELVGIDFRGNEKSSLLRIYIDKPGGIVLDDCSRVSYQVSGVLDVEDPISGRYSLEVSSPGLDRPIFKASDYQRFAGERIKLRLQSPFDGRRKLIGVLRGLRDEHVIVEEEGVEFAVPLTQIDRANLDLPADVPRGGEGK